MADVKVKAAGPSEVKSVDADKAVQTVFTSKGVVTFENGVAMVSDEIAAELKAIGIIG